MRSVMRMHRSPASGETSSPPRPPTHSSVLCGRVRLAETLRHRSPGRTTSRRRWALGFCVDRPCHNRTTAKRPHCGRSWALERAQLRACAQSALWRARQKRGWLHQRNDRPPGARDSRRERLSVCSGEREGVCRAGVINRADYTADRIPPGALIDAHPRPSSGRADAPRWPPSPAQRGCAR